VLLKAEADSKAKDNNRRTALQEAAKGGRSSYIFLYKTEPASSKGIRMTEHRCMTHLVLDTKQSYSYFYSTKQVLRRRAGME
jgi:hypothetical protein